MCIRDSSYAHYVLHTERGIAPGGAPELFLETLRERIVSQGHFGGWGRHVLAWSRRETPTVTVRFEDLVRRPAEEVQRALAVAGPGPRLNPDSSPPAFEVLHEAAPWFFRRGIEGAWRDEMPEDLQALFLATHREAMERLGYV